MRRLWAIAFVAFFLLPSPRAQANELDGDLFENRKLQVRFAVPEGWTLTLQTGYPSLLAFISRKDARIALSFTRLERQQKLIQVVTDNNRALQELGMRVQAPTRLVRFSHQLWRGIAKTADGARINRQLFIPKGEVIYILTLSCPTRGEHPNIQDLDYVLESFKAKHWALPIEVTVRDRSRSNARHHKKGLAPARETIPPTSSSDTTKPLGQDLGEELSSGAFPQKTRAPPRPNGHPQHVEERAKQGRPPSSAPA
ncbi:MAG: hypothetical protein KAI47_04310, partial [Deltaproteobacteria bacterium]|nr:hypothetical protein [Deltaproteobacteria bacterium]